jgi:hypothetical protein
MFDITPVKRRSNHESAKDTGGKTASATNSRETPFTEIGPHNSACHRQSPWTKKPYL